MKKILIGLLLVLILMPFFGSCDLFNKLTGDIVTAPERVNQFITGVTAGTWGLLQDHFYGPGQPEDYEAMNSGKDYWSTTLFYDADSITIAGDPADDATSIDATMSISSNSYDLVFYLKQNPDDNNYYITLIDLVGYDNDDDVRLIGL